MSTSPMHALSLQRRSGRTAFLAFLCAVYVAILGAMPVTHALAPAKVAEAGRARTASPTFEQLDRNGDGFVDAAEAAAFPALRAALERAGIPARGKIDKVRFARALALIEPQP